MSLFPTLIADVQTVVAALPRAVDGFTELVVKVTTLVAAVSSLLLTLRNGRKTEALKIMVDGRLSQLLAQTKTSEHAKGMLQGTEEGLAEGRSEGVAIAARLSADRAEGRASAVAEGKDRAEGRTAGIAEGRTAGMAEGRTAGMAEEKEHRATQDAAILDKDKR